MVWGWGLGARDWRFVLRQPGSRFNRDGRGGDFRRAAADCRLRGRNTPNYQVVGSNKCHLWSLTTPPRPRIDQLQHCDLESALGEMECARLFSHPRLRLRFIIPIGEKGKDYEAEFTTLDGRDVCCEIKTKKEQTELSRATVKNTLESARKQLPKGKPGVVLLHIPEQWITNPDAKKLVEAAIAKAFRQSSRLVAIMVVWDDWQAIHGVQVTFGKYLPFLNGSSNLCSPDVENVFRRYVHVRHPNWIGLQPFVWQHFAYLHAMVKGSLAAGPRPDLPPETEAKPNSPP